MRRFVSDVWLRTKAAIIRSPIEALGHKLRWISGAWHRLQTPELSAIHHEPDRMRRTLTQILKSDSCCVDVGSHIGSFLSLVTKLAPCGQHVAIEPTPRKCVWLKSNFPEVDVLQAAASDSEGVALFHEDHCNPGYSHLVLNGTGYSVAKVTIDQVLCDRSRIDLIKIDTEGHELEVLKGAVKTIQRLRPALVFEWGTEYQPTSSGERRRILYKLLTDELGYAIFTFGDFLDQKNPLRFDEFRQCGIYPFRAFNYLAIPR